MELSHNLSQLFKCFIFKKDFVITKNISNCMCWRTLLWLKSQTCNWVIITDRVRSATGRLCFDTCLSVCPQGGVPQPGPAGGVPQPGRGTSLAGMGYSPARSDGGGTHGGVPTRTGMGYPPTGQQMEYLIRRGRYAFCVHAGGLSCWN